MPVGNLDITLRYLRRLSSNSKRNLYPTTMVNLKLFKRKCSSAVEASRIGEREISGTNPGGGVCTWDDHCEVDMAIRVVEISNGG